MVPRVAPREAPRTLPRVLVHPTSSSPRRLLCRGFFCLLLVSATATLSRAADPLSPEEVAWKRLVEGKNEEARTLAERILRTDSTDSRAACVFIEAARRLDRTEAAIRLLRERIPEDTASGLPTLWLGKLRLGEGRTAEAESLFALSRARSLRSGDSLGAMVAGEELGSLLLESGRVEEARQALSGALTAAEHRRKLLGITRLQVQLGRAEYQSRHPEEARSHLQSAIDLARRAGMPAWEGDARIGLSIYHRNRMDLDAALRERQGALEAYTKAGSLAGQARAKHYIAVVHFIRGELTRALRMLHEARALAEEAGDIGEAAGCLGEIAMVDLAAGDFDRAFREYEEAVRVAGDIRPAHWRAGMLNNLGVIREEQRRFAEALPYYEEALRVVRKAGYPVTEVKALENLGRCHCRTGAYATGVAELRQAGEIARSLNIPEDEAYALRDRGFCLLQQGDLEGAERCFAEAEIPARRAGFFEVQEAVLLGRAQLARRAGRRDEAERCLLEAVEITERVRRGAAGSFRVQSGYFAGAGKIQAELVRLLEERHREAPDAGYGRRALEVVQRAKARSFLDMLAEAEVQLRSRADSTTVRREAALVARLVALARVPAGESAADSAARQSTLAALEDTLEFVRADLRAADPRYAETADPQPCSLEEAQRSVLREGEVLLDYYLADSVSVLFVVTPSSFALHRLPAAGRIEEKVTALLPLLRDGNLLGADAAPLAAALTDLSSWLIAPAASELARARRAHIVPHGVLHYLPFEVLLMEASSGGRPAHSFDSLPFLIRGCDVGYAPSMSALARLRRSAGARGPYRGDLLLLGDPAAPSSEAPALFGRPAGEDRPLPRASIAEEIGGLKSVFPGARTRLLTGERACRVDLAAAGREGPFRFAHFAVHGIYNERRPRYSGLVLAPDPRSEDDGYLTMDEVYALDLECEMVVLSACASGLGEPVTGEGLVGLTRAFAYAGARSVVAALWEVSGRETSRFMQRLYRELARAESADRIHALSEVKRWMIREGGRAKRGEIPRSHPFFWAAFVLTGDGS